MSNIRYLPFSYHIIFSLDIGSWINKSNLGGNKDKTVHTKAIERQTDKVTNIHTFTQIHRHRDKEAHKQRDKETDRQTAQKV